MRTCIFYVRLLWIQKAQEVNKISNTKKKRTIHGKCDPCETRKKMERPHICKIAGKKIGYVTVSVTVRVFNKGVEKKKTVDLPIKLPVEGGPTE